jgi:hypothetical protein
MARRAATKSMGMRTRFRESMIGARGKFMLLGATLDGRAALSPPLSQEARGTGRVAEAAELAFPGRPWEREHVSRNLWAVLEEYWCLGRGVRCRRRLGRANKPVPQDNDTGPRGWPRWWLPSPARRVRVERTQFAESMIGTRGRLSCCARVSRFGNLWHWRSNAVLSSSPRSRWGGSLNQPCSSKPEYAILPVV